MASKEVQCKPGEPEGIVLSSKAVKVSVDIWNRPNKGCWDGPGACISGMWDVNTDTFTAFSTSLVVRHQILILATTVNLAWT